MGFIFAIAASVRDPTNPGAPCPLLGREQAGSPSCPHTLIPMPAATPPRPVSRSRSALLAILLLWIAFYASFTLMSPPLLDDADSVHAEVAREMLLRHDYVTLYANGIRYLEKAPLLYWSMAVSFKLFGVSAAAARIPLALTVL